MTADLSKVRGPYHWHPNEDYCIKCGKYIERWASNANRLIVDCSCSQADFVHPVLQQIHFKCLDEVKAEMGRDKVFVWEIFEHLGIGLPLT